MRDSACRYDLPAKKTVKNKKYEYKLEDGSGLKIPKSSFTEILVNRQKKGIISSPPEKVPPLKHKKVMGNEAYERKQIR